MLTCREDERHFGDWCAWCSRFSPEVGDARCIAARERVAQKIENELRTPQPSHAAGILFAILVLMIAGCALG